ncbi:MAG: sporulation protein YabP [Bacilli bacterium]|nr:sporulation protein YabP [Bacilli bacterium]
MDKIDTSINSYNHSVNLLERKTLVITGVKKIDTFDNLHFILDTTMGFMVIKGEGLELIKLDTQSGNVTIKGRIDSLEYLQDKYKKNEDGILSRLFRS